MKKRSKLSACPFCGESLAAAQAELLVGLGQAPEQVDEYSDKADLLARVRQLELTLATMDEFGHRTAHDLKEPIRKIVSFGDLLEYELGSELSPDALDYLESMKRSARRAGMQMDALLEYSRSTRFEVRQTEVNLARVVDEVRSECAEPIKQTGAFISMGYLPTVVGDGGQTTRILLEFFKNAFRFHNPRRKGLMLQVWAELGRDLNEFSVVPTFMGRDLNPVEPERARWFRISLQDNGRGFSSTDRERIFDPYIRLGQTRDDGGVGLGLAICRRIAEQLGGRVTAIGHLDKGATFSLWLPKK